MAPVDDIEEIAKRRGFFWLSQEIYGGVSGFYDYGPLGSLLKRNIESLIVNHYLQEERCLMVEAPVLTSISPWIASGHVESFTDMIVECEKCREPYRADHLVEEKGEKVEGLKPEEIQKLIMTHKIKCGKCSGTLGEVYSYNLMFKTTIGPGKSKIDGALRPETAQTTYMPFRRLFEIGRKKLPMGVIQVGKSFRNEISPRKALVRLREFTQAEIQFFINPKNKDEWAMPENTDVMVLTKDDQKKDGKPNKMNIARLADKKLTTRMIAYFLAVSINLYKKMGIDSSKLRLRQHRDDERSFYSSDTWDVEFMSEKYGRIELVGIADRTDYDLKRHQQLSKQSMEVNIDGEKFVPHILEVAYGIDRPLLCALESCIRQDGDRVYFSFPSSIAPYQVAVFPLVNKDGLPEKAKEIYDSLKRQFLCLYDYSGSIGKLYYRQDEAGTSYCITVDYDTLKDNSVTLRDRDTKKQVRVSVKNIIETIEKLSLEKIKFEDAGKPL